MDDTSHFDLHGVWTPIITPFGDDDRLDERALRCLAERLLADGVAGLVALGTTGEPATLSAAERRRVAQICGEACRAAGRPLIVGAGSNNTASTVAEIDTMCAATDVDAALVVVPYYTRPSERAVVEHFHLVADSSPVPIVAYNIPYRTGRGLGAEAIADVAEHDNVVGLKQSVGQLDRDTLEILRRNVDGFAVLAGDDAFICPTVLMGGAGAIAAASHVCTPQFVAMVDAALSRDVGRAVALAAALLPVVDAGFAEPSPAVWKGALRHFGEIGTATLRRPMTAASEDAITELVARSTTVAADP